MYRLICLISLVILMVFCTVWQNVKIIKVGYDISKKEKILNELKLKNRILEVKAANLKSLDRIEEICKKEIGLAKAEEYRVIYSQQKLYLSVETIKQTILPKDTMFTKLFSHFTNIVEANTVENK
jgi:cell division protein FtsB